MHTKDKMRCANAKSKCCRAKWCGVGKMVKSHNGRGFMSRRHPLARSSAMVTDEEGGDANEEGDVCEERASVASVMRETGGGGAW